MADSVLVMDIELLSSIYMVLYKDGKTGRVDLSEMKCPR